MAYARNRHAPPRPAACILLVALLAALALGAVFPAAARAASTGILNARVVLRKSAEEESKALQTLPKGDEVDVLSISGSWYKVSYGKYTGYVMKKYVTVSKKSAIANADKIKALGDAPGALHVGDEGTDVKKLQKALDILGFYEKTVDGKYGDGTTTAVALYQQAEGLTPDGIAGKSTIKAIFGSCAKTADITVSGEDAADAKSTGTTTTKSSKSTASSSSDSIKSIEDIGTAPAASKEGDSGTKVKKLQQALKLLGYYSGDVDGDYGDKTIAAVKRFQKNRGMNQDGVAGSSTIRVLFGTSSSTSTSSGSSSSKSEAKTYKTEVLDWFADNVSSVIPKKAKFTIKDVRSGKTFTAVRWSGLNHMDAEPATKDDTAAMKKIFGGAWSWNRRAILILYRGHVYAASMNGMPHGTSTIDNNFDGHFCIHFKNSKTHDTKNVDDEHQKAVNAASKATW
jgi:peptidoglycan hydrolase-like protein with peptidoglycan-binding domain